ncbi:MAG: hypothetical protein QHH14_09570 [Clostridiales bacterium]|nr:hypothetical protein [Clostridiales bacterium]
MRSFQKKLVATGVCLVFGLFSLAASPQAKRPLEKAKKATIDAAIFKNLSWRNIGPAIMVGRVADIEGVPGNPNVVFVGTASGGVWKTEDAGVTWKPIFDDQPIASIGDIALEPGNPDVIYVGTGESNTRNSVSFGNGVYKSTDGGATWTYLGLADTERISRIVINPRNPQVVYVGALGHAFGPSKERGVFMSEDGGKTWAKVLYTDDRHGVADMDIDWQNPNILYAALWHFERKPWTFRSGSGEGGIWRSLDGGKTWAKLTEGLPKLVGRISVKVSRTNPRVVYAMTESKEGTLYRSDDRGQTFRLVSSNVEIVSRGFYYTDLRIDPADENRIYAVSSRLFVSIDGGKTFQQISRSTHVDYHALWIDPENPGRMWQGQDGGIAVSYDRGITWDYVNTISAAQFYQIYADDRQPCYYVGGGLQDNGTWYAPSRSRETFGILNDDWRMISFGDGFHTVVHPDDPDVFLSESQGGNLLRTDMKTREQQSVSPQARRGDGGPVSQLKYRFNWNAPIIASPHDPRIIYFGGNVVFKSRDFGTTWEIISPDLTTNDPEKQKTAGGPAWTENTTAEYHCTIISLAESPAQKDLLWAGTDDGRVHISPDGGKTWQDVTKNIPGVPAFSPVSHIEPSRQSPEKAYCAFDRHMFDDFRPYIFKTSDFGKTWTEISGNLPDKAYVWVVREDPKNPNLIYAGTELGFYASYSAGKDWVKLHLKNLPTVAVHDILVHPRENDLILGTHGRGIWILDDATPVQQSLTAIAAEDAYLFDVRPAFRFAMKPTRYGIGDKVFQGPNPPYGALITYYLMDKPAKDTAVRLEILDSERKVIRTIAKFPLEAGINRVAWDLRSEPPRQRREREVEEDFFTRGPRGPQVLPGIYSVRLTIGEKTKEKPVEVKLDPALSLSPESLRLQHDYSLKLIEMTSALNDGLRALDSTLAQLEEREKTLQTKPAREVEGARKILRAHKEQIQSILETLARPEGRAFWSEGSRLAERLSSLFGVIDGVNAVPTEAQVSYFEELVEEFRAGMARVRVYLVTSAGELSDALSRLGIPGILVSEPPSLPAWVKKS